METLRTADRHRQGRSGGQSRKADPAARHGFGQGHKRRTPDRRDGLREGAAQRRYGHRHQRKLPDRRADRRRVGVQLRGLQDAGCGRRRTRPARHRARAERRHTRRRGGGRIRRAEEDQRHRLATEHTGQGTQSTRGQPHAGARRPRRRSGLRAANQRTGLRRRGHLHPRHLDPDGQHERTADARGRRAPLVRQRRSGGHRELLDPQRRLGDGRIRRARRERRHHHQHQERIERTTEVHRALHRGHHDSDENHRLRRRRHLHGDVERSLDDPRRRSAIQPRGDREDPHACRSLPLSQRGLDGRDPARLQPQPLGERQRVGRIGQGRILHRTGLLRRGRHVQGHETLRLQLEHLLPALQRHDKPDAQSVPHHRDQARHPGLPGQRQLPRLGAVHDLRIGLLHPAHLHRPALSRRQARGLLGRRTQPRGRTRRHGLRQPMAQPGLFEPAHHATTLQGSVDHRHVLVRHLQLHEQPFHQIAQHLPRHGARRQRQPDLRTDPARHREPRLQPQRQGRPHDLPRSGTQLQEHLRATRRVGYAALQPERRDQHEGDQRRGGPALPLPRSGRTLHLRIRRPLLRRIQLRIQRLGELHPQEPLRFLPLGGSGLGDLQRVILRATHERHPIPESPRHVGSGRKQPDQRPPIRLPGHRNRQQLDELHLRQEHGSELRNDGHRRICRRRDVGGGRQDRHRRGHAPVEQQAQPPIRLLQGVPRGHLPPPFEHSFLRRNDQQPLRQYRKGREQGLRTLGKLCQFVGGGLVAEPDGQLLVQPQQGTRR